MTNSIHENLVRDGYVFIKQYRPDLPSTEVGKIFGTPLIPWEDRLVQSLVPRSTGAPNTYSGIYGLNQFPLHTDLAHWRLPPRYLLLRCIVGSPDVATLLADGRNLMEAIEPDILFRALFRPRRPRNRSLTLLRLCETTNDGHRIRWDEIFIKPASRLANIANYEIRKWLSQHEPVSISLERKGDVLLLDNWRMMHARSSIPNERRDREIHRIYFESLH